MDLARFRHIVEIFRQKLGGTDIHPRVGVLGLSTATIVEGVSIAHATDFRTFQISLPSGAALNNSESMTFFRDVCGTFLGSQLLRYNLPRIKRVLNGHDYRRLAEAAPNLVLNI